MDDERGVGGSRECFANLIRREGGVQHGIGNQSQFPYSFLNHLDQAREQLSRTARPLPRLKLDPAINDLFAFTFDDIAIEGYDPMPAIKAPVAV